MSEGILQLERSYAFEDESQKEIEGSVSMITFKKKPMATISK
jgi:hypothetical protein